MKLVIPPECQVGPHTFKIRWNDKLLRASDLHGQVSGKDTTIRLATGWSPSHTLETLLHEVIHAIDFSFTLDVDEKAIDGMAACFTQVLLSLGIEPDFSQISEE